MTARFLFPLASAALVSLTPLRAEIHVDDPVMIAALEDYAEFAAEPPPANTPKETVSPLAMAISEFFGFSKVASSSDRRGEE